MFLFVGAPELDQDGNEVGHGSRLFCPDSIRHVWERKTLVRTDVQTLPILNSNTNIRCSIGSCHSKLVL